ncbi:MAG: hypothetical protein AAFZ04_02260 [Pseudomonadota bacterium]
MMQTDAPDMMDLFARLFCSEDVREHTVDKAASNMQAPMPELSQPPVPLSALLQEDASLLPAFFEWYRQTHAPDKAVEIKELEQLLKTHGAEYFLGGKPAERLRGFVYPVV